MDLIYNLGAGSLSGFWLAVLIAMLLVEFSTVSLTSIWFAAGALCALIAALLGAPEWLQFILFAAAALILIILIRPISIRFFKHKKEKTNVEGLIGKDAVVTEDIDNVEGKGEATVNGMVWTARLKDSEGKCEKGKIMEIDSIEGVKFILKERRY